MELRNRVKSIVDHFEKLKKEDPRCGQVLCGTCGGYGSAIKESIDEQMHNEISEVLDAAANMDIDEIKMLYRWAELLSFIYGYRKMELITSRFYYQKGKSIDLDNIRDMDNFLFHNRWSRNLRAGIDEPENFAKLYDSMLKTGIELAVKTRDSSLAESIFIILGYGALEYPDFIEIVLKVCPDRVIEDYLKYSKVFPAFWNTEENVKTIM